MHAGYLLEHPSKSEDMFVNLIQIFRQMVFHNYFPMHDKLVFYVVRKLKQLVLNK
jgi:hypothetical protein